MDKVTPGCIVLAVVCFRWTTRLLEDVCLHWERKGFRSLALDLALRPLGRPSLPLLPPLAPFQGTCTTPLKGYCSDRASSSGGESKKRGEGPGPSGRYEDRGTMGRRLVLPWGSARIDSSLFWLLRPDRWGTVLTWACAAFVVSIGADKLGRHIETGLQTSAEIHGRHVHEGLSEVARGAPAAGGAAGAVLAGGTAAVQALTRPFRRPK